MQPEQLVERIAATHGEPDRLTEFRHQAATNIDPGLVGHIDTAYSHHGSDRIDVTQATWERLQDRKTDTTTIQPLSEAVHDDPGILKDLPGPATPIQRLCQSFFTNGIHIQIEEPEDTVIQPVLSEVATPKIDLVIVQATAEAEATVVEGCSAPRSAPFRAGYTIIDADEGSNIRYGNLQHWSDTLLLDATRSLQGTPVDHFLSADKAVIESEAPSRTLTPDTAFQTDAFQVTDMTDMDGKPIEHEADSLTNLPQEYRAEIDHILGLGD